MRLAHKKKPALIPSRSSVELKKFLRDTESVSHAKKTSKNRKKPVGENPDSRPSGDDLRQVPPVGGQRLPAATADAHRAVRAAEPRAGVLDLARHAGDGVLLVLAGDEARVAREAVELARLDGRRRDDVPREEEPRVLGSREVVGLAGGGGHDGTGSLLGVVGWRELLGFVVLVRGLRRAGWLDC